MRINAAGICATAREQEGNESEAPDRTKESAVYYRVSPIIPITI